MPLKQGKSEKAFSHNVKAEMDAGKPQKQALAISYAMRRKAMEKKSHGGMVDKMEMDHPKMAHMFKGGVVDAIMAKKYGTDGDEPEAAMVDDEHENADDAFLSADMEAPEMPEHEELEGRESPEDEKMKRKAMLADILEGLSRKHMGR